MVRKTAAEATGFKEKVLSFGSGLSGLMGAFSSWTVCHNVCTAAIAALAVIGITVTGMPLLFLQSVAVPFWTAAVVILSLLLFLKIRKMGCISGRMLLLNSGLIVTGIPFQSIRQFSLALWLFGGGLIAAAVVMFAKGRINRK